jgi:hypothetical protein
MADNLPARLDPISREECRMVNSTFDWDLPEGEV